MKIFKSILFLLIIINSYTLSQQLYFCEGVTDDGLPIRDSNLFYIPDDGGYLYFLVQLPYDIGCDKVFFEIYKLDSYNNEKFFDSFSMDAEEDWDTFWVKYTFYKTGKFRVYVNDCYNYELVSSRISIEYK